MVCEDNVEIESSNLIFLLYLALQINSLSSISLSTVLVSVNIELIKDFQVRLSKALDVSIQLAFCNFDS